MFSIEQRFIICETKKLDIDKWYKGCELNHDPHLDNYEIDWIEHNAKTYRDQWFNSKCSSCSNWEYCGWKATNECDNYEEL